MSDPVVVVGAGIGGLASALALARQGVAVRLLEQAPVLTAVGAGLQLGPNAVRVLSDWGLLDALKARAAFPERLLVRDALSHRVLGQLPLGASALARYGQPYACMHRADLQDLLLQAVHAEPLVTLQLGTPLRGFEPRPDGVWLHTDAQAWRTPALLGCDGLWSQVRQGLLGAEPPRASGHLAYRGLLAASDLPANAERQAVSVWLGPRLHVVCYPVRGGQQFNLVAVVHGQAPNGDPSGWSLAAQQADLLHAMGPVAQPLSDLLQGVQSWRLWALHDRPPMTHPSQHAQGRVALLGDAAHPLRPYLAQGAAMALEDAWTLGRVLSVAQGPAGSVAATGPDWPSALARFAELRWRRNAKVQARSQRNGTVFHANGPLRWGRDTAIALLGRRLLDQPWLYGGPPQ